MIINCLLSFLKSNKVSFDTSTEKFFNAALERASQEEYSNVIQQDYQSLIGKLKSKKINELVSNKNEIKQNLQDEIVKRYYYKKGEYINKVNKDVAITRAVELLSNTIQYNQVLK